MDTTDPLVLLGLDGLPPLAEREVQVLVLRAGGEAGLLPRAYTWLSAAERERADRIRVDGAREEFIVGRAALRGLLGSVLGMGPDAVPLETDSAGKPFVPGVHSNVSHSHGWIYVALCRSAAVGVDVEWIDPKIEAVEIAAANFAPEEIRQVAALQQGADRARAFCTIWTRKEALAKADGRGLSLSLAHIHVPGGSGGAAWIGDPADQILKDSTEFHVQELSAPSDFVASLAVQGRVYPVRFLPNISSAPHFPV